MSLPSIIEAVEFRREQYGWTQTKMASELFMAVTHYNEFIHGKRGLPYSAMRHAFRIGVPAKCLFQIEEMK